MLRQRGNDRKREIKKTEMRPGEKKCSLQMRQKAPGRGQEVSHCVKRVIIIVLTKIGTGGKVFRYKVESEL